MPVARWCKPTDAAAEKGEEPGLPGSLRPADSRMLCLPCLKGGIFSALDYDPFRLGGALAQESAFMV